MKKCFRAISKGSVGRKKNTLSIKILRRVI